MSLENKSLHAAFEEYENLRKGQTNAEQLMEKIRGDLKSLFDLPEETGIFIASSEHDAHFIPIIIGKALGHHRVLNILTQQEITHSDTISAAYGEYFSNTLPIQGYVKGLKTY